MTALQVPKKKKLPSEKTLQKEIVQTLSGVNVLEFNIKMLMKHLSKPHVPSTRLAFCLLPGPPPGSTPFNLSLHSCPVGHVPTKSPAQPFTFCFLSCDIAVSQPVSSHAW